ncbi:valacyclovir hydrolase-like [Oppia nitens]|uniref:valacyclovir hydrolase-like n=1 Tax=Oppia nitens TaxID=1686743 RepID=UPI0023DB1076|nr:valacyclovir hydrolase-like [Oppia nitens]
MSTEGQVFINNDCFVYYEVFGSGPQVLLMIPGAIGTGRTDYSELLIGSNALDHDQFTLVAIELPGWGRSRPPHRQHSSNVFTNDADCCVQLMRSLGYEKFQVLGWSEGTRVALVLAANYPDLVTAMVGLAMTPYASDMQMKNISYTVDTSKWSRDLIDRYLRVYKDRHEIQQLWEQHTLFIGNFLKWFPNGICNNNYDSIKCRIFLIHGDRDKLVELDQIEHLQANIANIKVHRFPMGGHNMHLVYQQEVKLMVENFLLNK